MEIPKSVKIGGMVYRVEDNNGLATNEGLIGRILYHSGLIELDSTVSKERKEQVFVHELLHGVFYEAGYEGQDEQMEEMVDRLGKVLHQVLKDNTLSFNLPLVEPNPVFYNPPILPTKTNIFNATGPIEMNNTDIVRYSPIGDIKNQGEGLKFPKLVIDPITKEPIDHE